MNGWCGQGQDFIIDGGVGVTTGIIENNIVLGVLMFVVMLTLCRFKLF